MLPVDPSRCTRAPPACQSPCPSIPLLSCPSPSPSKPPAKCTSYTKFLIGRDGVAKKRFKPGFDPLEFESGAPRVLACLCVC